MKTLGIVISPNNIFNRCIYYTSNRVFAQDNPNQSASNLNPAYAMSEDDKKYFYEEYYTLSCGYLSKLLIPFRKRLIFTNNSGMIPTGFSNDFLTDRTVFYMRVADKAPLDIIVPIMAEILKLYILLEWYRLKNLYEEVGIIGGNIDKLDTNLSRILSEYSSDKKLQIKYNMGFSNDINITAEEELVNVGDVEIFTSPYSNEFN